MGLNFSNLLKTIFLALLSPLFLVLSFPNFSLGILSWVGLLPLLLSLQGKGLRHGFLVSLFCGILFFMGIFYWILQASGYTLLHHALLAVYLGFYFGCFGLVFNFISRRLGMIPALWAAPFLWVFLEYIRSNLSFLALPWTLLAHSQYQYPVMIQMASVTGTYGISFLMVMVNAALTSLFLGRPKSRLPLAKADAGGLRIGTKGKLSLLITAGSFLLLTLAYGYFTITDTITGDKIKLSLVQGNIEQSKKWDPKYAGEIMATYSKLTLEASKAQPAFIIWPETATPGSISADPKLLIEIKEIAEKAGTYLLLGSAQHQKFEGKEPTTIQYLNSAYLIHPDPKVDVNQRYDKIRLFPFGEYLPFKELIPWSLINVRESGGYGAGKKFMFFKCLISASGLRSVGRTSFLISCVNLLNGEADSSSI
jgi:apolipoprotein N-acyltransferase